MGTWERSSAPVFLKKPFLKIRLFARVFAFVRRKLVSVVIAFSPCLSTKRKSSIRKTRFYSSFARARRFLAVAFSPCLSRERPSRCSKLEFLNFKRFLIYFFCNSKNHKIQIFTNCSSGRWKRVTRAQIYQNRQNRISPLKEGRKTKTAVSRIVKKTCHFGVSFEFHRISVYDRDGVFAMHL